MTGAQLKRARWNERKRRERATARLLNKYSCPVCGKSYDRPGSHIHFDGKQDVVCSFVLTVKV